MNSEERIETENEEKQQHIPYRYENAKDNEYQPKQYNNSIEVSESGGDIMKKINEAADNLEPIIDKNKLKIFSKYEDLNIDKLKKLLEEKTQNLINLNNQKENSKIKLSNLLKELNKTITDNAEILYKDMPDPEVIFNLKKEIDNKKKELKIVKNMNHSCKCQYNAMNNKLNKKNNNEDKENGETKINNIKNENKQLQIDIRKYKDEAITKKKDIKKIVDNNEIPNEIKKKSEEIRNLTNHKHECFTKIKMGIKSLENVRKEISHFEEIFTKRAKENGDENLNNKINFWLDIIKSDLSGTQEEIMSKIEKKETNFMKEINKNNNNRAKSSSFDENKKNNFNEEINSNFKLIKEKNNNLDNNNLKISYKGIFGKFKYLKQKPYSSTNNYKLSKINISSEEIKNNKSKKENNSVDSDIILAKDYEDTTDNEYRELLNKKSQYLEANIRLEKNIKEIEKTKKSKLLNISYTVKENEQKLKELKEQNNLLEQEIINLQNLYQLTIDKEMLKKEIKEKEKKNKKILIEENNKEKPINTSLKLETSLSVENNILNELKESKNKSKNKKEINKKINKNKSGYVDDFIPDKNVIETREQRLKKIREKYLDENEISEIKENKDNNYEDLNKNMIDINENNSENIINKNNKDENNINSN